MDVVAVDQALAKRTKHDWGAPPAGVGPDRGRGRLEILDDVDLNGCLEQDVGYGGAKNAVVKLKPFEPPTRKSPGAKRGRKKKAGEPKQRWSGEGRARRHANKPPTRFMSAGERLDLENAAKGLPPAHTQYRAAKETNGATRTCGRGSAVRFVPPYGG